MQTVPVPIVVGPQMPGPLNEVSIEAADGVIRAATMAENGGGWFFSRPMYCLESCLVFVHDFTGLPWWATILALTGTARLVIFPMQVAQSKAMAKMTKIKPQLDVCCAAPNLPRPTLHLCVAPRLCFSPRSARPEYYARNTRARTRAHARTAHFLPTPILADSHSQDAGRLPERPLGAARDPEGASWSRRVTTL